MSGTSISREEIASRISLRKAVSGDGPFFYNLYRDSRKDEVAAFGFSGEQQDLFFQMQFRGLQHSYSIQADIAEDQVILLDDVPIGRLVILRTAKEIRLADIAVMSGWRDRGIGTFLIRKLLVESNKTGKPVTLHVQKGNPAAGLYSRLGFVITEDTGVLLTMERRAATTS